MPRCIGIAAATALFFAPIVRAEPPRHIEFIEGLRARGMADLALEYLNRLAEKPPPELRTRIALEIAKTTVELAEQGDD